jgi:MFS family permease
VLLLACAQALFQTASVMVATVGSLAGARIAPSPALATAPMATMVLGTAVATVPAALWMARVGRRPGFLAGALLGTGGGLVSALGVGTGSLALLCLGTFLVGLYQATAQFYRFAASEVAGPAFRPRAIALVLGGGIVAALAGPTLAELGGPLLAPEYLGSFLALAAVSLVGAGVILALRIPAPAAEGAASAPARPWRAIVLQPAYRVAFLAAATGYGVMILAMTATPVAMETHHHTLAATATVIQFHVLGMFLPSFFTGSLIVRFGVVRVMLAGVAALTAHVLATLTGTGFASFGGALVLLGIGWNLLFIGGTTLLTTTYGPAERGRAQGTNDMAIFAVGLVCALGAGVLLDAVGWRALNLLLLPWLGAAALILLRFGASGRRAAAPAVALGPAAR